MTITSYALDGDQLRLLAPDTPPEDAMWIDLYMPGRRDRETVGDLGQPVPRPEDMQSIEPSRRIFSRDDTDMITVHLTETDVDGEDHFAPVTFMLSPDRLITVRYHGANLWDGLTLTNRATPGDVMMALLSLSVGHIADLLELRDRQLDRVAHEVFSKRPSGERLQLRRLVRTAGRMGETLSEIRLNLLILQRALVHLEQLRGEGRLRLTRKQSLRSVSRDVEALTVHADFLTGRVTLAVDAIVGLISLTQNDNARIFSVVAVLFLPATLIASIFGMNFEDMPMLKSGFGFEASLILMAVVSVAVFLFILIRRWL